MRVEQAGIEVQDQFPHRRKTEVAWFDDARVDRPHWDAYDTLTLHHEGRE